MGFGFVFSARDLASRHFDRIRKSFEDLDRRTGAGVDRLENNLKRLKVGLAGMAAGAVVVAGSFAIAKQAGEFEAGIAKVGAISRASAADMAVLEEAATAAGLATQFSPQEAAEGLANFASQGLNATQAAGALVPALDLAAGGSISVAEATESMTAALKVFGLGVDDAGLAADKLLRISNTTALRASDLSLALGTVGRGATAARQSLDEMLPAMGLVKNTGVDASVAASSVSSALLFMAKNAEKFGELGVKITDAQGRFRPFLDVVRETDAAMAGLSDEKRVTTATELFGRFGLTAFSAISGQLNTGITDATGRILQGAEALNYLRSEMAAAGGTAEAFKGRLLDTFEGQKKILSGVFSTLIIEIGRPFAQVLKPLVMGLSGLLSGVIKLIAAVPAPIKRFFAGLLAGAGVLALVIGGFVAAKAAILLLIPAATAALAVLAPFALVAAKVGAVVAAVGGAVYGLTRILTGEFSSIGGFLGRMWRKVELFHQGIVQLFRDGGFSGAVRKELGNAENSGLKAFVVALFRIGSRIRSYWQGFVGGFAEAVGPAAQEIREAFAELWQTFEALADELSGVFGELAGGFADFLPAGKKFESTGAMIGAVVGLMIRGFAKLLVTGVRVFAGIVGAVRHVVGFFRELASEARTMGDKVGGAFRWLWQTASSFLTKIGELGAKITEPIVEAFSAMVDGIRASLVSLQDFLIRAVRKIPDWALPERLESLKVLRTSEEEASAAQAGRAAFASLPAAAQAEAQIRTAAAASPMEAVAELRALAERMAAREAVVVVKMDGQKVGEGVLKAQQNAAARAFEPVRVVP